MAPSWDGLGGTSHYQEGPCDCSGPAHSPQGVPESTEIVNFRLVVAAGGVTELLRYLVACERVVRGKVGEVQQQPQVETWVAQRDLDILLAALPEDVSQVLDVIRLHPVVTVADEPELYWFSVNWRFAFGSLATIRDRAYL